MAQPTLWWLLAGASVALELATGTFYLLMFSLGLAAAAVAAHLGLALPAQIVTAALVGGGAVVALYLWRRQHKPARPDAAEANPDLHLDIGATVTVAAWRPDGTADVLHRGARWTVLQRPGTPPALPGTFRVVEVVGSRLLVEAA